MDVGNIGNDARLRRDRDGGRRMITYNASVLFTPMLDCLPTSNNEEANTGATAYSVEALRK
jgi:hypothetical protein